MVKKILGLLQHVFVYYGKSSFMIPDVASRINKARNAFAQLNPVWKSSNISRRTQIKIFNYNVKSTLLYGCETWNMASCHSQSFQVLINACVESCVWSASNYHTLRAHSSIDWNLQGSRRIGLPLHTWEQQIISELSYYPN